MPIDFVIEEDCRSPVSDFGALLFENLGQIAIVCTSIWEKNLPIKFFFSADQNFFLPIANKTRLSSRAKAGILLLLFEQEG